MTDTPKKPQGFAALSKEEIIEIARKGGIAAHAAGTAHRFKKGSAEASAAGRKGALANHAKRKANEEKTP